MALFRSNIHSTLERTYTSMLQAAGHSAGEARQLALGMLERAERRSKTQGSDRVPPGFGDTILAKKDSDPGLGQLVARLRQAGVRDDDIRWWWNLHDLERCMMLEADELAHMAVAMHDVDQGKSVEEARANVRKWFPLFGTEPKEGLPVEDQPLPFELKNRINLYLERFRGSEEVKSRIEAYPSINAFIRSRIAAGEL